MMAPPRHGGNFSCTGPSERLASQLDPVALEEKLMSKDKQGRETKKPKKKVAKANPAAVRAGTVPATTPPAKTR
jgi:hypothetical protein